MDIESSRDAVAEVAAELTSTEPAGTPEPAESAPEAAPEPERASPPAGRDEKGRFAPKKEPAAPASPAEAAAGEGAAPAAGVVPAAAPVLPELKLPADWRAEAREKLKGSPREVQEEAIRLHIETKKALQELADARKSAEEWGGAVKGYEHLFGGQQPARAVAGLVQTYAQLHTAPLPQRAKVLAGFVRNFLGTDEGAIRLLAAELDGSPAAPAAPQQPQLGPQDLDKWYAERQAREARDAATKAWQEFETTAEFLNEPGFRQRLAVELHVLMADKGGQPTTADIKAAYDAASAAHPGVSKILNQRKEAEAAKAKASTQAAAAAAGVKNEPAGPSGSGDGPADTTREQVAREWKKAQARPRV